jgi:hypothetical protein
MSRYSIGTTVLLCALALCAGRAAAQTGFSAGHTDVGPTLGLGSVGSASFAFGGRLERGIKPLPDLGDGVLGISVSVDYYSWSSSGTFTGAAWESSVTYIPIGATANYHFVLDNRKIDPFLGLGLGYSIVSSDCSYRGLGFDYDCGNTSSSAVYFIGRAGLRYFLQNRLALYGDVGAGAATLNVGAMLKVQ